MKYSVDDLVRLARRENNSVRSYLYVNPLQGKHIPARPEDTLKMCHALADIVNEAYPHDRIFVIGFAETATGIASGVAGRLKNAVCYQNTTRENREGSEHLYFTESHSHATDQMLMTAGLAGHLKDVDRIIFVDDEVTTGNTICKLIDAIARLNPAGKYKHTIVSVLNSMTPERREELSTQGIDCLFLAQLPYEYNKEKIENVEYDSALDTVEYKPLTLKYKTSVYNAHTDPRITVSVADYISEISGFTDTVKEMLQGEHFGEVLVLGTEEFMYPAVFLGNGLKSSGIADEVRVHATTRSPIIASDGEGYPLFHRYKLRSVYNEQRTTYIYNLKKYDKVIIVTDSALAENGIKDLLCALESVKNEDILVIQWKYGQQLP